MRRRADPVLLAGLRARIRRLERYAPAGDAALDTLSLAPEIDRALPWGGLPRACLHEIVGGDGAAAGFAAALLARLAEGRGTVLWCRRGSDLYGPGLAAFGLGSERLLVVRGRTATEVLWAMEEGLRGGGLAAVLGEADAVAPTAQRRLQLAAETGGVSGLLLRSAGGKTAPGPAVTRWRISAAPAAPPGVAIPYGRIDGVRWRVELLRCRNGAPAAWLVEWRDEPTGGFAVVADLRHRPADQPAAEPMAGDPRPAG